MAKSNNQKAKILYLIRLLNGTGEDHLISMQQILDALAVLGIKAERKSIYDDFEVLRSFGMDICYQRGRNGGYYLRSASEDDLLANVGDNLVQRDERNASVGTQHGTAATEADALYKKAAQDDYQSDDNQVYVSLPEEGPSERALAAEESADQELPADAYFTYDGSNASGNSEKKQMKLLCKNTVRDEVERYFGKAARYKEKFDGEFVVTVNHQDNAMFFGWLTAMGKDVFLAKPKKTAQAYREYIKSIAKDYRGL